MEGKEADRSHLVTQKWLEWHANDNNNANETNQEITTSRPFSRVVVEVEEKWRIMFLQWSWASDHDVDVDCHDGDRASDHDGDGNSENEW